jgi:hypothetical protein
MATDYRPYVDKMADKYGVPRWLARAIYEQETKSGKNVKTSPAGAKGHMQLMPRTAAALGVKDINNPFQNIEAGVKYIAENFSRFGGDPAMAAAAYNYGPTKLARLNGKLPSNTETKNYVRDVLSRNPNPTNKTYVTTKGETIVAKDAPATPPKLVDYRPVIAPTSKTQAKATLADKALRGFGLATRAQIQGVGDLAGAIGDPLQYFLNKAYSAVGVPQRYLPQLPSQMAVTAANQLGLPKPETGLERVVSEGGQFATSAASGQGLLRLGQKALQKVTGQGLTAAQRALVTRGTAKGATQAARQAVPAGSQTTRRRVMTELTRNPATQVASATTAGIGSGLAGEIADQNPFAKVGGAIIGGAAGSRFGRLENAMNDILTPEGRDAIRQRAAAEGQGITVTAADVYPGSRFTRGMTTLLEAMPFSGMRTLREQNAQARTAVEALRNRSRPYNIDENATPKELGVRLINDLRDQYKLTKAKAGELYDAVLPALNKKKGTDQIAVSNAKNAITNFLSEFPDYLRDPNVPTSVKNLMRRIAEADDTQVIGYNDFRKMNTAFGQAYSEAQRAAAASPERGSMTAALGQVYSSLSRDADAWVSRLETQNPEAATAFRNAQTYFTENVLPFRDTKLVNDVVGRRLKPTEIDNTGEKFVTSLLNADEGTAQTAMRLSSEDGRQIARFALLDRAAKSSIGDQALSEVTPMRAFGAVDPSNPTNAAILGTDPDILAQTTQLSEALSAARRSTEAFSNPRTGMQLLPYAQGAGLIGAGYYANQNEIPQEYQGLALLTALLAGPAASAALRQPGTVRYMAGQTPDIITNPAVLNPAMLSIAQFNQPTELPPVSALPKRQEGVLTPQQEQQLMQSEVMQYLQTPEQVDYATGEPIVTPAPQVTIDLDPETYTPLNLEQLPEDF